MHNTLHDRRHFNELFFDHKATGFKIYGGHRFTRNIGLELNAPFFGNFNAYQKSITIKNDLNAILLTMVTRLPLGVFDVFVQGGFGAIYWLQTTESDAFKRSSANTERADLGFTVSTGIGVDYTPPNFSIITLRLAWERYWFKINASTIKGEQIHRQPANPQMNSFYTGLVYNF